MQRHTLLVCSLLASAFATFAGAADVDWSRVDQAIGRKGTDPAAGIHKFSLPRSDLNITVDGIAIKPGFALGTWLAFESAGGETMVMGDLVLTDAEISPVFAAAAVGIALFSLGTAIAGPAGRPIRATPELATT
jgi:hypothetical protein